MVRRPPPVPVYTRLVTVVVWLKLMMVPVAQSAEDAVRWPTTSILPSRVPPPGSAHPVNTRVTPSRVCAEASPLEQAGVEVVGVTVTWPGHTCSPRARRRIASPTPVRTVPAPPSFPTGVGLWGAYT